MRHRYRLAGALVGLALLGTACSQQRVNEAEIGVHYTDGPIEGRHFERIIEPGGSQFVVNDHVYKLPARQITWTTGPGVETGDADAATLEFNAATGEKMLLELSTRFVLNTTLDERDEPFKTFFTGICQKYDCWDGAIGGNDPADGWNRMLKDIVGNPQRAAAISVGRSYEGELLRYDSDTQNDFEDAFAAEFEELLANEVGVADIFCGPGYERGETDCPAVNVNVTRIVFADPNRESIREQKVLAQEQVNLAAEQKLAADAQQQVIAAQATPEYRAKAEADALARCGTEGTGCTFVITGSDGLPVTVPVN